MPANLPPLISITSPRPEYRAAETRLGEFIRAIQMGRRKRATELLSSRVTAEERQALIEKRWLRKDPRNRKDFTQVLFLPDLKIGTQLLKGETLELYVIPRPKVKKRAGGGYLKVRMRRENGQWLVDMHPDRR
jgi:hypothetical protein